MARVNVVLTQPGKSVWHFEHSWSHSLYSCCTDTKECCYAFFCPCCFECEIFKRAGEEMWTCMCPGARYALRSKIRTAFRIKGNLVHDCCATTFCGCCASIQIKRELHHQGL
ncbi:unnamed protein product [Adineta ricciae]|uniref:Cornifelin-like protein n=1 Tax=Adineta ricciae TaxID=249248 RepID=A0A816A851_ADIRI|nr:unnamed protein product [Adineta ricciae]